MKNILKNILLVVGFFLYFGNNSVFANNINVDVNGEMIQLEQEAINENGRVLVPLRDICENMGYNVRWNEETRKIYIKKDFAKVIFSIDKNNIIVNNREINIDVAPRIVAGRTYVPVRALVEAFDGDIEYIESENKVKISCNMNGNKNKVIFLEKEQKREIDGKKVTFLVSIPQILNYKDELAIDRINSYYKKEGRNAVENLKNVEVDNTVKCEGLVYRLHHNNDNIISFVCLNYITVDGAVTPPVNKIYSGDVFNIKTGEKLRIQDILKGTQKEIEQFLISQLNKIDGCKRTFYYNISAKDIENCVKEDRYYFYIDNGKLVLDTYFGEASIDISRNKELFNERFLDAMFGKDTDEEYRVIESAHKYFNKDAKIVDKTILGQDECYVFDGKNEIIAIDRSGEKIYIVKEVGDVYKILETKKVNDEIGNLTALKLVMEKMNLKDYSYELGGVLRENDEEYIIVTMRDLEEKVEPSLAVDKKTGAILAYYFE